MHVSLIVNVQKAFRLWFSSSEIAKLRNVGDLPVLIESNVI
jgi:acyl carrier protein